MTTDEYRLIPPPEAIPEPEAAPEEPPVWSGWATFGLGVAVLAVNTIVTSVITMVIVGWALLKDGVPSTDGMDFLYSYITGLTMDYMGLIIAVTTIVGMVVNVGMVMLLVKAKHGLSIREYLALRPINARTVLVLVVVTVGLLLLSELSTSTIDDSIGPDLISGSYGTSVWPALFWIALVIGAPVAEEVLFRGFLFEGFVRSRLGLVGAIVVTSLAWAMLHVQYMATGWQLIGSIFVMGLVFGYVRYKTGSLWSVLLMHGLNNLAAVIAIAFGVENLMG